MTREAPQFRIALTAAIAALVASAKPTAIAAATARPVQLLFALIFSISR